LTRTRGAHQITPSCHCEQFITAVLSNFHRESHEARSSVFTHLHDTSTTSVAKRRRSRRKKSSSDVEYPEVTSNMVGSTGTSVRPEKERPSQGSEESDAEYSPGLKGIIVEPEGVLQHTRTGTIAHVNYKSLTEGVRSDDEHSAIAWS